MGRSFYRPESGKTIEDFTPEKPFYHEASDCCFARIERAASMISVPGRRDATARLGQS